MKKEFLVIVAGFLLLSFALVQCNSGDKEPGKDTVEENAVLSIKPVPLPTNIVPGFNFPEDSSVILGWTTDKKFANQYDSASIYKHAWGIWAGLTASSGQKYAGDELLVYETWLGLNEIRQKVIDNDLQGGCAGKSFTRNGRAPFSRPKQFEHAAHFAAKRAMLGAMPTPAFEIPANFWVTVSYSPDASCFVTEQQVFKQSVINKSYKPGGFGAITPFPNTSLTIKPTYMVFDDTAVLFKLPVWLTAPEPADSNFFGAANNFVYVDPANKQPAGKKVVPVDSTQKDAAKIAAATVNLSDFISLKIDAAMASEMNRQDSVQGMNNNGGYGKAKKGQIALLVAMHVTTKEISNWTWQSYYWTPNRDQPGAPSSALAASLRPSQITGAAANYACVAAYVMLTPGNGANNDPASGPMFGYNPYLEGGFGPSTFPFANRYNKSFQYGSQSNCMSCHALAIPDSTGLYTTDQHISLADEYFRNQVSLDFAWSIQTALISDTTPYWPRKKQAQ